MPRSLKTGKSPAKRTTKLRETAADVQAIAAPSHADIATRAYQLFLQRGKQGWIISRHGCGHVGWRKRQLEVPRSRQSGPIDHDTLRLPSQVALELGHRIAACCERVPWG